MLSLNAKNSVYYLLLLLLVSAFGINDTLISYIICAVLLFFVVLFFAVSGRGIPKIRHLIDFMPAAFFLCWAYGFILGLLSSNELAYTVRNFAGMSLYLSYYIFSYMKLDAKSLVKIVFIAAIINAIYSYMHVFWFFFLTDYNYFSYLRLYYSSGLIVISPIISCFIASIVISEKNNAYCYGGFKGVFWAVFLVFPYAVFSFSKGFLASFVFLIMIYWFCVLIKMTTSTRISIVAFCYFNLVVGMSVFVSFQFGGDLLFLYSAAEASNMIRSEQLNYLVSEFSFWGNGLGAVPENDYVRNLEFPYGFELSYLNVIHKIGVFSILLFLCYGASVLIPLYNLLTRREIYYSSLALGAMMYLVPAYGNPILFGPISAFLHCIAVYWIKASFTEKESVKPVTPDAI